MKFILDTARLKDISWAARSEEHTSELQSQSNLVCRLLLEKKKKAQVHDHAGPPAGALRAPQDHVWRARGPHLPLTEPPHLPARTLRYPEVVCQIGSPDARI